MILALSWRDVPFRASLANCRVTVAALDSRKVIVPNGRLTGVRTSLGSRLPIWTRMGATRRRVIRGAAGVPGAAGVAGAAGAVAGALTSTAAVAWAEWPWLSVTVAVAVCRPAVANACVTFAPAGGVASSELQPVAGAPAPGVPEPAAEKPTAP